MPLIELQNIAKTYFIGAEIQVAALKNINLTVNAGEFIAIMGPSGSGKSTLLALLGLLDKADSGTYKLLGNDVTKKKETEYAGLRNQFFGFIFQTFNLLPKLNVVENSQLPFIYAGKTSPENKERLEQILKKIGLADRLKHRPNELSGGQQQRVAIARALANQPLVILADEPTGNLDSKTAEEIIGLLKELHEQGNTIIMVTHEPDLAHEATRTIHLLDGEIVSDQKVKEFSSSSLPFPFFAKKSRGRIFSLPRLKNYFLEALVSLFTNKLRSLLSILGVLIGVAAVITMLALGTGAQRSVEKSLSALGTNLLSVRSSFRAHGISLGADIVTRFTFNDLKALKNISSVGKVVPYVQQGGVQAVYKNKNWNTTVVGTSPDYPPVRDAAPVLGRFFNNSEVLSRTKVAVLGTAVAKELFGETNPVGQEIKINRINFKVLGVLPEKGGAGFRNADDQIIIPITTAMYRLSGQDYISSFDIQVADAGSMTPVQEEIISVLAREHRLSESQKDSITVQNMADIQKAATEMIGTLSFLLGSIAAISLLVGGIGIMNIMLVMVMERTHEIGLRKALGAENQDILVQFLVESILICFLGGVLGILSGAGASLVISFIAKWNFIVSLNSILLAFLFSLFIGLVFGLWPALRAAKLQPIVALRYE